MRQGVFCGLLFGGLSPGRKFAEFQKTRDEGLLAKFFHSSGLRALREALFAAKCCAILALEVHANLEMMAFARGCFLRPSF